MSSEIIMELQQIVDGWIKRFLEKIAQERRISSRKIHPNKSDFPIFHPANNHYFEYKYYENTLEWYIRDYLVTGILVELLRAHGKKIETYKSDEIVRFWYSTEQFGADHQFAFIIDDGVSRIGCRFSGICLNDAEFDCILNENRLNHIEIIDWTDTDAFESKKVEYGVSVSNREKLFYVTVRGFFFRHLSENIFEYYITHVKDAVEQANKIIGFQTIPNLSLRYLSDFRSSVLDELSKGKLRDVHYHVFSQKGVLTDKMYSTFCPNDVEIADRRFYELRLYEALAGNSTFAKCFLTSEYLYQIFRTGNEEYFDYSTVVSGYFKSVELLLEKAMKATFAFPWHEELWIQSQSKNLTSCDKKDRSNFKIPKEKKAWHTRFTEINYKSEKFRTEMGSLIYFIMDNTRGWYISDDGQKLVKECLLNYNKGCRNEHLHKDIINDIATVESIRDNTLLCLYYIIGGYRFSVDEANDYQELETISDSYTRLYKCLMKIPSSIIYFNIQFDDADPIMAVRFYDQDVPQMDTFGNIVSSIEFAKVNTIPVDDIESISAKLTEYNGFNLSREHVPIKMWWYNKRKELVEIIW